MKVLSPDTRLQASADCVVNDLAGEIVLLNLRNGTYYGIDQTGSLIWDLLGPGASFGSLVSTVHERTGVDIARIEADLRAFLDDLLKHELVDIDEQREG